MRSNGSRSSHGDPPPTCHLLCTCPQRSSGNCALCLHRRTPGYLSPGAPFHEASFEPPLIPDTHPLPFRLRCCQLAERLEPSPGRDKVLQALNQGHVNAPSTTADPLPSTSSAVEKRDMTELVAEQRAYRRVGFMNEVMSLQNSIKSAKEEEDRKRDERCTAR